MTQTSRQARREWAAACQKHIKRGSFYNVEVRHDYECAIYTPMRLCDCNPDRILKDYEGRVLARVSGAGPYRPLEMVEASL